MKPENARRDARVGFLMRSFFASLARLSRFAAPQVDQLSENAPGTIMDEVAEISDGEARTVEVGFRRAWLSHLAALFARQNARMREV